MRPRRGPARGPRRRLRAPGVSSPPRGPVSVRLLLRRPRCAGRAWSGCRACRGGATTGVVADVRSEPRRWSGWRPSSPGLAGPRGGLHRRPPHARGLGRWPCSRGGRVMRRPAAVEPRLLTRDWTVLVFAFLFPPSDGGPRRVFGRRPDEGYGASGPTSTTSSLARGAGRRAVARRAAGGARVPIASAACCAASRRSACRARRSWPPRRW